MAIRSLPEQSPRRKPLVPLAPQTGKPDVDRFMGEVVESLRALAAEHTYSLVDLEVSTTPAKVVHKLGRPYRGWYVVDANANDGVYRVEAPTGEEDENLATHFWVQSGSTMIVRLKVF